jgi:hypothetical protein
MDILEYLTSQLKKYPSPLWCPQPGPQSVAYLSEAEELLYGGAVGGGKSQLALGAGLTAHLRTLLLRNESSQLEGFTEAIAQVRHPGDHWKGVGIYGGKYTTAQGRQIELSGCSNIMDADKKFRGRRHDLKAWDELATFPEEVYHFINGWNATTVVGQRCRIIGTSNPPKTPEQEWILDYYRPWLRDRPATALPGELLYYAPVGDRGEMIRVDGPGLIEVPWSVDPVRPVSRTFIPSSLEDNPMYAETGYKHRLANTADPKLRLQLLKGDMYVGLEDHPNQVVPSEWYDMAVKRWHDIPPHARPKMSAMGVDPARGGKDHFTIAKRYENWVAPILSIPGRLVPNGKLGAMRVFLELDWPKAVVVIDITGTAGGDLFGSMSLAQPSALLHSFVASARSEYRDKTGQMRMRNKRTEAYWRLRDALDPKADPQLALPPDPELRADVLTQRGYMFIDGVGLDDKDTEVKKRIGRSPDKGDALAMSFMDVHMTGGWVNDDPVSEMQKEFMGLQLPSNPAQYEQERKQSSSGSAVLDWG